MSFWWASGLVAFLHFWFPVEAMLVLAEVLFLDMTNLTGERESRLKTQILLTSFPIVERSDGENFLNLSPKVVDCMSGQWNSLLGLP